MWAYGDKTLCTVFQHSRRESQFPHTNIRNNTYSKRLQITFVYSYNQKYTHFAEHNSTINPGCLKKRMS